MSVNKLTFFAVGVLSLLVTGTMFQQTLAAFIHFKPENKAVVKANEPVTVNGTSAPSNSTRTGCNVMLNVNSAGYGPVKATGPGGMNDYTKWSATTPPMKAGTNELEAQLLCHNPNGTGVSFVKHLVHNVTTTTTTAAANNSNSGSPQPPTVG